jgi:hypothetical protein
VSDDSLRTPEGGPGEGRRTGRRQRAGGWRAARASRWGRTWTSRLICEMSGGGVLDRPVGVDLAAAGLTCTTAVSSSPATPLRLRGTASKPPSRRRFPSRYAHDDDAVQPTWTRDVEDRPLRLGKCLRRTASLGLPHVARRATVYVPLATPCSCLHGSEVRRAPCRGGSRLALASHWRHLERHLCAHRGSAPTGLEGRGSRGGSARRPACDPTLRPATRRVPYPSRT